MHEIVEILSLVIESIAYNDIWDLTGTKSSTGSTLTGTNRYTGTDDFTNTKFALTGYYPSAPAPQS